jgi:hypothetical protein
LQNAIFSGAENRVPIQRERVVSGPINQDDGFIRRAFVPRKKSRQDDRGGEITARTTIGITYPPNLPFVADNIECEKLLTVSVYEQVL